jgi:hypothetical protein
LQADINGRLLDILRRGSEKDFSKFIECLKKTGQEHVANVLLNDGAVAHLVAKTNCSATEETHIVNRTKEILGQTSRAGRGHLYQFILYLLGLFSRPSSSADTEHLYSRVGERIEELSDQVVELMAFSNENSIGIFYFCQTLAGLQHLNDLYSSGHLKLIFENIISELLNDNKLVVVESLYWGVRDFVNCMQCLCSSVHL